MVGQYSIVCEDDVDERVRALAREYGLTEEEVLRQLIQRGLEQTEAQRRS